MATLRTRAFVGNAGNKLNVIVRGEEWSNDAKTGSRGRAIFVRIAHPSGEANDELYHFPRRTTCFTIGHLLTLDADDKYVLEIHPQRPYSPAHGVAVGASVDKVNSRLDSKEDGGSTQMTDNESPAPPEKIEKYVRSVDVLDTLKHFFGDHKREQMKVSDVGILIYQKLTAIPEFTCADLRSAPDTAEVAARKIERLLCGQNDGMLASYRYKDGLNAGMAIKRITELLTRSELTHIGTQQTNEAVEVVKKMRDEYAAKFAAARLDIERDNWQQRGIAANEILRELEKG